MTSEIHDLSQNDNDLEEIRYKINQVESLLELNLSSNTISIIKTNHFNRLSKLTRSTTVNQRPLPTSCRLLIK